MSGGEKLGPRPITPRKYLFRGSPAKDRIIEWAVFEEWIGGMMRVTSRRGDKPPPTSLLFNSNRYYFFSWPARERERAPLQPAFHLVPERGLRERPLDAVVEVLPHAQDARPPRDVVVDRLGERVRLLEDHSDPAPNRHRVDARA